MANRRPLVQVDGELTEIPVGDKIDPSTYDQGAGAQQVFVQDTAPTFSNVGIWVQTGLGDDGTGFTFWFEDGT